MTNAITKERLLRGLDSSYFFSELFDGISKNLTTDAERILALRGYGAQTPLMTFLYFCYNAVDNVFDISRGEAEEVLRQEKARNWYPQDISMCYTNLTAKSRMLHLFTSQTPKETKLEWLGMWFAVLHPIESELVTRMFDHSLSELYPWLTTTLVKAAFPDLFIKRYKR